jgi:hypothetical protein
MTAQRGNANDGISESTPILERSIYSSSKFTPEKQEDFNRQYNYQSRP